ncbi:MAG: RloB domain-containing protein [Chitinophagales bacterium]|nr:RloB domain-containing protein [Chitinophagales bacterium]
MARKGTTGSFNRDIVASETRIEKWRKYQYFILIVCEDQNTEPTYISTFKNQFPEHTLFLEVAGSGLDPLGVVNAAIREREKLAGLTNREIDEIWVVFDKDDADKNQTRIDRFNNAFSTADDNNFKIAWSNEVFELWFLLHFEDIAFTPLTRAQIYDRLRDSINQIVGSQVIDNGHSNIKIIPYLSSHGNETNATERAEQLIMHHNGKPPINSNPATMMHALVKSLREWIIYYNYTP